MPGSRSRGSCRPPSPGSSRSATFTGDTLDEPGLGAIYPLTPLEQARRIADLAREKLARDITILDMRPACSFTDYFVICTGRNPRQTQAIYEDVRERLKADERVTPRRVDGVEHGTWILADYLDVVFHVFTPEAREYYRLEELWGDVPSIEPAAAR